MRTSARARYAGYRFPAEIIGHAVWLYFRFPLGLRMVEELLAARGIMLTHHALVGITTLSRAASPRVWK
jgi:putative transposase